MTPKLAGGFGVLAKLRPPLGRGRSWNRTSAVPTELGRPASAMEAVVYGSCRSLGTVRAAARSPDSSLRYHRNRKRQLAIQEPSRRSPHNPRSRRLRKPDQLRRRERYRPNSSLKVVKIWAPIDTQRSMHAAVHNTFNVQRHLISRPAQRLFQTEAMQEWHAATMAA
jgi:hypothetical protein